MNSSSGKASTIELTHSPNSIRTLGLFRTNDSKRNRSNASINIFQALTALSYFFPDKTPSIEPGATKPEFINMSCNREYCQGGDVQIKYSYWCEWGCNVFANTVCEAVYTGVTIMKCYERFLLQR